MELLQHSPRLVAGLCLLAPFVLWQLVGPKFHAAALEAEIGSALPRAFIAFFLLLLALPFLLFYFVAAPLLDW